MCLQNMSLISHHPLMLCRFMLITFLRNQTSSSEECPYSLYWNLFFRISSTFVLHGEYNLHDSRQGSSASRCKTEPHFCLPVRLILKKLWKLSSLTKLHICMILYSTVFVIYSFHNEVCIPSYVAYPSWKYAENVRNHEIKLRQKYS